LDKVAKDFASNTIQNSLQPDTYRRARKYLYLYKSIFQLVLKLSWRDRCALGDFALAL